MKMFKLNSQKKMIISKNEWLNIGFKNGWCVNSKKIDKQSFFNRKVPNENEFGYGLNQEAMNLLYQYDINSSNLYRYDDPNSMFQDIYSALQQAKKGNNEALKKALESRFGKVSFLRKKIF